MSEILNREYCSVCDDKGVGFTTKQIGKMDYTFVLYCPFCEKGKTFAYDGRKCKEKSHYYAEPITKYYSDAQIEEMRRENNERQHKRIEREGIEFEEMLKEAGYYDAVEEGR